MYLLDFDRNSKPRNAAVTGGVTPSALEEQSCKEPTNPTNPKEFFSFTFHETLPLPPSSSSILPLTYPLLLKFAP